MPEEIGILVGDEPEMSYTWHSQPYLATHDGQGNHLPVSSRSFISFNYNGKDIEDFDLIVVTNGDRISRSLSSSFKTLTSTYDLVDGQYYWGYSYDPLVIDLTLSTNGITEQKLQEFRKFFVPGIEKSLILAETANRVGYARVNTAPQMSMLPFEYPVEKTINEIKYTYSTTMWKGDIQLQFVLDDPFWYAIQDSFGSLESDSTFTTKDKLKIYIEDGIPFFDALQPNTSTILLANNKKCYIDSTTQTVAIDDNNGLNDFSNLYFYNPSTAPVYPTLEFSFVPTIDENTNYINFPANDYAPQGNDNLPYNTITVGNEVFHYTTPAILNAYNQAVEVLDKFQVGDSWVELQDAMRNTLNEYYMRGRAAAALNQDGIQDGNGALLSGFDENIINFLQEGFLNNTISCIFNSKTGEATLSTKFNVSGENGESIETDVQENAGDMVYGNYLIIRDRTLPIDDEVKPEGCLTITSSGAITAFKLDYKYTYL